MLSSSCSSFSSCDPPQWIYNVFLSFRGEDTRDNFVSHLYNALSNAAINTFLDDHTLRRGRELRPELMLAIEVSQISIVVFSQRYAQSQWCLMELEKIMKCHRTSGQVVLPVFVDVDPSIVRKQKGAFGEALKSLTKEGFSTDQVQKWRDALNEAAKLAGWDKKNLRDEAELVKIIVDDVLRRVSTTLLFISTKFPVGLESRVQEVVGFIKKKLSQVCVVGIWGMGGLGKSTIAKAIYNQICRNFENRSFIENIREACEERKEHIKLQKQLLFNILKTRVKIDTVQRGLTMIKERLHGKKALIVLDDVNKVELLDELYGNCQWLGSGSVLIITTRDVKLLQVFGVDRIYKMKVLDENESLELFSWHAFREASPREDFITLSRNAVAYCGGLPLALRVLGSYLYQRGRKEWESVLSKLKLIPHVEVQKILTISFDGLEDQMEKNIFLDICCFFIGKDRAYVTEILNGCGLHADIGIAVLVERSLLEVEKNNKLQMHDLLRDMGREIIRESSIKEPGKRNRLWFHDDVHDVLTKNTGTKSIEGLTLKLQETSKGRFNCNAFKEMNELRLLQFDYVKLTGDFGYISKQLRWIYWKGFPLRYIPNNFYQGRVVAIDFKHSHLKEVWKKPQLLECLKILNLSHSLNLRISPDFSKLPNLEKLILKHCTSLCDIHQSIGDLHNLLLLNLKGCTNLNNLPRSTYTLKSVKTLIISDCSKIDKLEEDIEQMKSLTTLIAEKTSIKQVPVSIVKSKCIGYISLCGYEGFSRDVFPSIISSWISPTMNPLSYIHSAWGMSSFLVSMDVHNYNLDDLSPILNILSKLRVILLQCNTKFQLSEELRRILDDGALGVNFTESESYTSKISNHSLRSYLIGIGSCQEVFNILSKSISEELTRNECCDVFLPNDYFPYWRTHRNQGHSVLFRMPQHNYYRLKGMILCVVYSSPPNNIAAKCLTSILIVNNTKYTIQIYKRDTAISFNDEDWKDLISHLDSGDEVQISFTFGHELAINKTAVYLTYD